MESTSGRRKYRREAKKKNTKMKNKTFKEHNTVLPQNLFQLFLYAVVSINGVTVQEF